MVAIICKANLGRHAPMLAAQSIICSTAESSMRLLTTASELNKLFLFGQPMWLNKAIM